MHLSDAEEKMVARLRKQQRSMVWLRWVGLCGCMVCFGEGGYLSACLEHMLNKPEQPETLLAMALFMPWVYILLLMGGCLLCYILAFWNGKPETRLLLRLIEASVEEEA